MQNIRVGDPIDISSSAWLVVLANLLSILQRNNLDAFASLNVSCMYIFAVFAFNRLRYKVHGLSKSLKWISYTQSELSETKY